jgi:pimeloyl-ACP methyl ester carboxylesterase
MTSATINGVKINYRDGGTGPAVLLSHGYSATGAMWNGQRPALEDRYRVITWDMRGHGSSESPEDQAQYSERHTVDDMAALLDHLGIDQAVIGGLSLGGYMSLAFHLAHPERTRALVLCDTGPGYRNPEARDGWNRNAAATAERLEKNGLDALGRGAEVRIAQHESAAGLAKAARGMLAQFDSRVIDSLPDTAVPTIVIVGSEDKPFIGGSEYMAKKIPGGRLEVIEGAGHAANIDKPDDFNRVLLDFLDTL